MSDSIVIIPTYNEKENIEKIIRAVFGLEKQFDILVIDDGSPDGTTAIINCNSFHQRSPLRSNGTNQRTYNVHYKVS